MLRLSLVLAWSVTVEDVEVIALIEQLGDDRFTARVAAQTKLERILLSPHGHVHRQRVVEATRHPDLEIRHRAARALEAFYDVRPRDYPAMPWIDMLPPGRADRQAVIDGCLNKVRSPGTWGYGTDWPDYRQATAIYARQLLEKGYPRHCVQHVLDEMVSLERQYREKHGMRVLAAER